MLQGVKALSSCTKYNMAITVLNFKTKHGNIHIKPKAYQLKRLYIHLESKLKEKRVQLNRLKSG
jgi:hypothetical protein